MKKIDDLVKILEKIKNENNLDGIKVYYQTPEDYAVKGIKDGNVVITARKRTKRNNTWDTPKPMSYFDK